MILNYITITWRNLIRNKSYALLNILGLTTGMTAAMLILLFVYQELSYDRYYPQAENIYRATMDFNMRGISNRMAITPTPLGPALKENYPEVASYCRISPTWNPVLMEYGEKKFYESSIVYADSGFFKTFGYELIAGDEENALKTINSLVMTRSLARKYFGEENPVGKTLRLNTSREYTVTGLMEDVPVNSHLRFDALASFATLYDIRGVNNMDYWTGNINYFNYFRLVPGTDPELFGKKMNDLTKEHTEEFLQNIGGSMRVFIQPVTRIHLHSDFQFDMGQAGSMIYVYVFLAIALLILLVAVINYTNLATAQSIRRMREVGLRKVMGAHRKYLIGQFLSESVFITLMAFVVSMFLVEWLLPFFGNLVNRNLSMSPGTHPLLFTGFLGMAVVVGIVSGFYPALYATAWSPAGILKMEMFSKGSSHRFRNLLVVSQFFISIALIVSTIFIYRQLQYMSEKELGFNREQVVVVPLRSAELRENYPTLKDRMEKLPGVVSTSVSQNYLGRSFSFNAFREKSAGDDQTQIVANIDVDKDFFKTFHMEIVEGRGFRSDDGPEEKSVVVNETLVKKMGWEKPLGKQLVFNDDDGYVVVGVVKDFHITSLRQSLEPVLITHRKNRYQYINIRLHPGMIKQTMQEIDKIWKETEPEYPLDYRFIDQSFNDLYEQEQRLGGIFVFFSLLAVLSALVGLYSLVAYSVEQRTREIAIRRVMGAGIPAILRLFSREFLSMVALSTILAWPAVYFFIRKWLEGFAYQTPLKVWPFLAGAALVMALTVLVVILRSYGAASANPANSLRHE
ncbi:MAG: ABC transporter permease [Bacteroidales bacterium]